MSAFRILHLSDIHIGRTYKPSKDIALKLVSDIDHNALCLLKSIIVTGDIFDGQVETSEALINEAVCFFETILEQINLSQEDREITKNDFIFIPGNHDLVRVDDENERWEKYRNFLLRFYDIIPAYYDLNDFSVFKQYSSEKIVFIGFNSCQIEKKKVFNNQYLNTFKKNIKAETLAKHGIDKNDIVNILENEATNEYDDYGYIPMTQIMNIERKVRKLDNYNVIALFHHHFYLFPEIAHEFGDISLIRNYSEFIQHLKYMNVRTVMHGHKHFDLERPFISEEYYDTTESIINVFSGGSVGTIRKEKHTFSVIDIFDRQEEIKMLHHKFVYEDEALSIRKKQIPPLNISIKIIRLLEILRTLRPDAYREYIQTTEKIFKIYNTCNCITNWVSDAITGFKDIYRYIDDDYRYILFILYSINYRVLYYKAAIGKETSIFESASVLFKEFFKSQLANSSFLLSEEEYHSLFTEKKLREVANICDQLLNKCTNKSTQLYLAFSMIGIFFSDLYLVFTEYADDFKESIKYKINIKIEENKFHENVPAPRIIIESDADRRSVYVQLVCNEPTAHKMAVLFVKEFDLLINKFEDYFKLIGLKLYYLIPKINKDNMKDTLDNYNFEAYIPTLLPLLTGDNIYPSKVVFARELIQNSIDAIAVREAKDTEVFPKEIIINIGKDENDKRHFLIKDCGTGMDRYKIERYFTSIGRSFYSGDEYADLNISYKPISSFGIGFLSSFMVCQEIDVKTRFYLPDSEALKLHIPNYDGCFFIERSNHSEVGTEIKLYLNSDLENKNIINYIRKIMLDIKYDILIKFSKKIMRISAHQIRERNKNEKFRFFIPFTDNDKIMDIDYESEVLSGEFINKYEYGILIHKHSQQDKNNYAILNAGILIEQASLNILFDREFGREFPTRYLNGNIYNDIIINLPANWIQLDVSREKLTGFSEHIRNISNRDGHASIGVQIAEALYKQILGFMKCINSKVDLPTIYLQDVIENALAFCGKNKTIDTYKKLMMLKYVLHIKYNSVGIVLEIVHRGTSEKRFDISFENTQAVEVRNEFHKLYLIHSDKNSLFEKFIPNDINERPTNKHIYRFLDEIVYKHINLDRDFGYKFRHVLETSSNTLFEGNDIYILFALLLIKLGDDVLYKDKASSLIYLIEFVTLQRLKISDVEGGNNQILIRYDELTKL